MGRRETGPHPHERCGHILELIVSSEGVAHIIKVENEKEFRVLKHMYEEHGRRGRDLQISRVKTDNPEEDVFVISRDKVAYLPWAPTAIPVEGRSYDPQFPPPYDDTDSC